MSFFQYSIFILITTLIVTACNEGQVRSSTKPNPTLRPTQAKISVQLGHLSDIHYVAFFPDGQRVLSSSNDNSLKLWDVKSGRLLRTFPRPDDSVKTIALSPDGQRALLGNKVGTMKLLDMDSGRLLRTIAGHSKGVNVIAFSPDGLHVLSGGTKSYGSVYSIDFVSQENNPNFLNGEDQTLALWEVDSGRLLRTFKGHSKDVIAVAFSTDGRRVLSGSRDKSMKLWEVDSGRLLRSFEGHSDKVSAVAFSPDGQYALSGSSDQTLKLWELDSGRLLRTFKGHTDWIESVVFSPDGRRILSGSADKTLKLWEVNSGRLLHSFIGHSDKVKAVAFSPDGQYVLSGSGDKTMKLWELDSGRLLHTLKGSSSPVSTVAFSPKKQHALLGVNNEIKLLGVDNGRFLRSFTGHSEKVNTMVFSSDGQYALSGSDDKTMKLWEVNSGRLLQSFSGHSGSINAVSFSPTNGQGVLSGSSQEVKLWKVDSGQLLRTFKGLTSTVISVAFSTDGQNVLAISEETAKVWNANTGRVLRSKALKYFGAINAIAFTYNLQSVFAGYEPGALLQWNLNNGRLLRRKFYDEEKGALMIRFGYFGHADKVNSVAVSPDGQHALSGSSDHTVKLWKVDDGKLLHTFLGHSTEVQAVAFLPNKQYALSTSQEKTVLWNLKTGKEIAQMVFFEDGEWITITPEGYYTASLNGAKYLNVRIGNQVYGIDQYQAIYHRPDIVKLALELGNSQKAVAELTHGAPPVQIAQVQPPKVWLVSPQSGSETKSSQIEVQVKTQDIADSTDAITFIINGRPMGRQKAGKFVRPNAAGVTPHSRQVPLIIGENWIEVEVRGKAGAVQRTPPILVVRQSDEKPKPTLYYLGIGVAQHPQLPLKYPVKDVKGLESVLKQQRGKAYQRVISKTITDQQATRGNIIQTVTSFFKPAKQGDIAILFISGHGMNSDNLGYYFLGYDANPDQIEVSGVSWKDFNAINDLKANVLFLADTCHSGNLAGNAVWQQRAKVDPNLFLRDAHNSNVIVFASSSGEDVSIEDPKWGHGAFTKALIDGLNGKAADAEGIVDIALLQRYVRKTVPKLTDGAQKPTIPRLTGSGEFLELVLARKSVQSFLDWYRQPLLAREADRLRRVVSGSRIPNRDVLGVESLRRAIP